MSSGAPSASGPGPEEDDSRLAGVGERIGEARQAAELVSSQGDLPEDLPEDTGQEPAARPQAGAFEPSGDEADAGQDPQDSPGTTP